MKLSVTKKVEKKAHVTILHIYSVDMKKTEGWQKGNFFFLKKKKSFADSKASCLHYKWEKT